MFKGLIGQTDHPTDLYSFTGRFNLHSQYFYKSKSAWPNAPFNFDISNATKDKEISTTDTSIFTVSFINPTEIYISPSGDYLYTTDRSADRLARLDMTTPFDIETGSVSSSQIVTMSGLGQIAGDDFGNESSPYGLFFRRDGLKFYIVGTTQDAVACFNLSIAWDLSSVITFDSKKSLVNSNNASGGGFTPAARQVFFKPDGSRFYVVEDSYENLLEFSIPSGEEWSLTNATQVGNSLDLDGTLSSDLANPKSIYIEPTGVKVFIHTSGTNRVYELEMTTAWDLSTLSMTGRDIDTDLTTSPSSVTFSEDSKYMYVCGVGADKILRYS